MTLPYMPEQQIDYQIEYWDTPFSPLYNDVASNGMRMDVYDIPSGFGADTFLTMDLTSDAAWNAALDPAFLKNGRMPNAIGYWAGGAPGYHGAGTARRVAYRIQGVVRSSSARAWFSAGVGFNMKFGVAGSGRMRITVNDVDKLPLAMRTLSESTFLTDGHNLSDATTLSTGDVVKIYYVQDEESWGGFVVKPMINTYDLESYRAAPVLGCGLISYGNFALDNTNPVKATFTEVQNVTTEIIPNQARRASIQIPLVAMSTWDGVGWEWSRDLTDETGHLRLHRIGQSDLDLRRQRLIRVSMGFRDLNTGTSQMTKVFTGFTDDFEVRNGIVTISCLGFEQRLADQYVKNYPDRISYMTFGYKEMSGTQEPVFNVTAYDNWPIEHVFRDLMMRGGIDASRCWAPIKVRQPDGSLLTVVMT